MDPRHHSITSACGQFVRDAWLLTPLASTARRLCVFLDAELYLQRIDCLAVIEALTGDGAMPPLNYLFISCGEPENRHIDFTCSDRYSRFIACDVMAWAKTQIDELDESNHMICGVSLSGLAAAHVAFAHPSVFAGALCQSGSFWWLADRDIQFCPANARLWLSVGNEELDTNISHPPTGLLQRISQIEGVERAMKTFESLGASVKYNVFAGGHAFARWRDELAPALRWLTAEATDENGEVVRLRT
jgi:enterochelin esterase family protein